MVYKLNILQNRKFEGKTKQNILTQPGGRYQWRLANYHSFTFSVA